MRVDLNHVLHIYEHPTNEELRMANAALTAQLSELSSVLSHQDSVIASQSTVIAGAPDVSSAVSAAVDAEDTEVAGEISSALSAG